MPDVTSKSLPAAAWNFFGAELMSFGVPEVVTV
jgi:hypothetical protein